MESPKKCLNAWTDEVTKPGSATQARLGFRLGHEARRKEAVANWVVVSIAVVRSGQLTIGNEARSADSHGDS
jgi:hypothetical protein